MSGSKFDFFDWDAWTPTEEATLMFVMDGAGKVLLIHKKRGLGKGKINGPGGRIEPGETPKECAIRETCEEVGLCVVDAEFCGNLMFHFVDGYDLKGYVFKTCDWTGEPVETDEARPEWFGLDAIPYHKMWADDRHWFPLMIEGKVFTGRFVFDGDAMLWRSVVTEQYEE